MKRRAGIFDRTDARVGCLIILATAAFTVALCLGFAAWIGVL